MKQACFEQNESCPYKINDSCYKDEHHKYYYRSEYQDLVERVFRNLPENIEELCRYRHEELHRNEFPPDKPSRDFMLGAISVSEVYLSERKKRELGLSENVN